MKKFLPVFEPIFTIFALLHYTQGISIVLLTNGASEGDGVDIHSFNYTPNLVVFFLIYLITFSLLLLRWKKVLYVLSKEKFVTTLMILTIVSVMWTEAPIDELRGSFGLIGTTAFGIYFATRYTLKEQVDLLSKMYIFAVISSIIFAVALPKYGIMGGIHAGALRGIYGHKNTFGKIMILGATLFWTRATIGQKNKLIYWGWFIVTLGLLIAGKSTSSLINLSILLFAVFLYQTFRLRYEIMVPLSFGLIILASVFSTWFNTNADKVLGSFGKDTSLTGRTDIWPLVIDMIQKKPWFGYGLGGFWKGLEGDSAYVLLGARWEVPDAHNGFLDLTLTVGIVGLTLFALGYLFYVLKSIVVIRQTNTAEGIWPLLFLTYLILVNLAETSLLAQNAIYWVLYTTIGFSLVMPQEKSATSPPNTNSNELRISQN